MKLSLNPLSQNNKGMSLIEVLIMSGILTATGLVFASMIVSQNAQVNYLDNRMAKMSLENLLLQRFSQNAVCSWQLENKIINATGTTHTTPSQTVIDFSNQKNSIYTGENTMSPVLVKEGEALTSRGSSSKVSSIRIRNILRVSPDLFSGDLTVSFDGGGAEAAKTGNFSMSPVVLKLFLHADPASPVGAKVISSCGIADASGKENMELIWQGSVGGGGDRAYGSESLMTGKRFSDYSRIYIIGNSKFPSNPTADNTAIGITGKVNGYIPVFQMKDKPGYLFDIQTFSGDDSGSVGIQYINERRFRWGTFRGGNLNEIWGVK